MATADTSIGVISFSICFNPPPMRFAIGPCPSPNYVVDHSRVGVVFCGKQSPGGHNVVWGLLEALKVHNPKSIFLGFLGEDLNSLPWIGGSQGLFAQKTRLSDEILATYKNQGGYDLLGRTQDQIKTTEQVNATLNACTTLKLDALVIIGAVTSNTDAAQLAETFAERNCPTKVVGITVTLNGDLKNQFVERNVGFDTICKVNSQLISNVATDALSAEKYYIFIRLMGRKASHVALECTLQSHPNMVILAEEMADSKLTLFDITKQICDAVQARGEQDKHHGVILLPEGLIESFPEVYALLRATIFRYLVVLALLACHWDLYFHSSGDQKLSSHAHNISSYSFSVPWKQLIWQKEQENLKKTIDALHQEERSGSKGRKWRKNVKVVETELLLMEEDVKALEEMYPQGEKVATIMIVWTQLTLEYAGNMWNEAVTKPFGTLGICEYPTH